MTATMISRLLGFARNAVVGALFGQSWKADVLNAVFTIPFNLRKLMAEGAFSTAFIPVLSKSLVIDPSKKKSIELTRAILTFQVLVLMPLTLLCIAFAQPIIALLAPFQDPQKQALAVDLFRWFINYLFLISLSAVLMAVLNSHNEFAIPAISPVLFSLAVILSLVILFPFCDIYAQIPGVLLGGLAQILFQYFYFRKLGYTMKPLRKFWTPELKETLKKWAPALSISGIALLDQQISITLAATLKEGSVSALSNAIVFWQLPAGVLSASVITVFFPRMSRQVAQKDWKTAAKTMTQGLELQALLLIPAGFFMGFLSEPIIGLAFQRHNFTYNDTVLAAQVLAILSWGLFTSGIFNFLQRFFFAQSDFKTPFFVNLVWAGTDLLFSLVLMQTPLGVRGLAFGSVIGFATGALLLLILAWRNLPWRELFRFLFFALRVSLALVPVYLILMQIHQLTGDWWVKGFSLTSFLSLVAEGAGGLVIFLGFLILLGIKPWVFLKSKEANPV